MIAIIKKPWFIFTILIGCFAIFIGVFTYKDQARKFNERAVKNDIRTIGGRAAAWYLRPKMFGGGGQSFCNFSLKRINFPEKNGNGSYEVKISDSEVVIKAKGVQGVEVAAKIDKSGVLNFIEFR